MFLPVVDGTVTDRVRLAYSLSLVAYRAVAYLAIIPRTAHMICDRPNGRSVHLEGFDMSDPIWLSPVSCLSGKFSAWSEIMNDMARGNKLSIGIHSVRR
jgi:hypothetical protein